MADSMLRKRTGGKSHDLEQPEVVCDSAERDSGKLCFSFLKVWGSGAVVYACTCGVYICVSPSFLFFSLSNLKLH